MTLDSPLLLATAAAFAAVLLLVGAAQSALAERRTVNRSLRAVRSIHLDNRADLNKKRLADPATTRVLGPAFRRLSQFVRRITPVGTAERINLELAQVGSPPGWDVGRVFALKFIVPGGLVVAAFPFSNVVGFGDTAAIAFAIVCGLVGWHLPEWVIRSRAHMRQAEVQKAMPDTLDLLSITVQAGLAFDAALARVSREVGGPLGQELHRVVQEIQLGEDRVVALRALAERNPVPEVKSFVLAMTQADTLGISVSSVLEVQADEFRLKRRQRAEERAQKLPVKLVFPLLFCIFPSIFVVVLGPAAIRIWETIFQAW